LDDFLFDDENFKPLNTNSVKKIAAAANNNNNVNNTNKNTNNANLFQEIGGESFGNLNNSNKRKGVGQIKSGRKDILEEIFGDDLFSNNRTNSPMASKTKSNLSKKNLIATNTNNANNNPSYNKYDDLFTNNPSKIAAKNNDPFDFGLDYEPTFLKDESNKPDNQFNTRRSRYLPSGKRDNNNNNLFNVNTISSATKQQNSAKGWNQTPIKITVGNGGIGPVVGGGPVGSGKQSSYVPSFVGSGKGDKSKNLNIFVMKSLLSSISLRVCFEISITKILFFL
jgi:hypothetical protein